MRKWIVFGSVAIVLILFFTLTDFGSETSNSSVDALSEEAVVDPGLDSEQTDPLSMNTDEVVESSNEPNEVAAAIPASGRIEHEIETERLLKEIFSSSEINLDVLADVDTETALDLINIASGLADRYRYKAGLPWANDALRMDPGLPEAHLISGYLNFKLLHTDEVIAAFEKTIALDPLNFDAHLYLGRIYNGNDNPTLAMEYLTNAIEIATTPEEISLGFTYRGLAHALLDQYDECLADLEDALYLNPDNGWAILIRAKMIEEIKLREMDVLEKQGIPGEVIGVTP